MQTGSQPSQAGAGYHTGIGFWYLLSGHGPSRQDTENSLTSLTGDLILLSALSLECYILETQAQARAGIQDQLRLYRSCL